MFTGIIEEIGTISEMISDKESVRMTIQAPYIMEDVTLGDSISVNGVCLTVNHMDNDCFTVDLMPETVKATSLSQCMQGSRVNLERAMSAASRFGGHIVSGHVDGTAIIKAIKPNENAVYFELDIDESLSHFMVYKGSVTVDGTSLTIFGLEEDKLILSLIPHTMSHTIFGDKKQGDTVNIEMDMMAKYIDKYMKVYRPNS